MDEDDINDLIQRCALLKHKVLSVFAANNFPQKLVLVFEISFDFCWNRGFYSGGGFVDSSWVI